jgi:magnesium transporter
MSETATPLLWEDLIHSQRWEQLRARLMATHSSDIADAMGQIHGTEQAVVFRLLSREQAAQVFSYLPAQRQKELLRSLSTDEVKGVLDGMPPDDRTRFFEEMPAAVTRQLLEVLSPEELKNARQLLGYPEHSVGRYMTPDYVAIRPDMTAAEALEHIRTVGHGMETLNVIYNPGREWKAVRGRAPGFFGPGRPSDGGHRHRRPSPCLTARD